MAEETQLRLYLIGIVNVPLLCGVNFIVWWFGVKKSCWKSLKQQLNTLTATCNNNLPETYNQEIYDQLYIVTHLRF